MKISYYNGMVLFTSGVSGKGQLRLKGLFSTCKIVWSVSRTENLLIYTTLMSNCIYNTAQQPIKKLDGLQEHKIAMGQIKASVWEIQGSLCSVSPSRRPLLLCEICTPVPFSHYPSLRQLTACFLLCKEATFGFLQRKRHFGEVLV